MSDPFKNLSSGLESPATGLMAITPDDGADLPNAVRAINVAVAGLVRVTTIGGQTEDVYLAAGVPFPIRVVRVWATGTTATGIRGLW